MSNDGKSMSSNGVFVSKLMDIPKGFSFSGANTFEINELNAIKYDKIKDESLLALGNPSKLKTWRNLVIVKIDLPPSPPPQYLEKYEKWDVFDLLNFF